MVRDTRENNRSQALLDAAAALFATQGYAATTVRDITAAAGMASGSAHYHFRTKADLLLAVYRHGVAAVATRVDARLAEAPAHPRDRIEAALVGHVEAVLDPSPYARVIVSVLPANVPELADELRAEREHYEDRWRTLIEDLEPPMNQSLLRQFLLGAANSTQLWFSDGGLTPQEIGQGLARLLPD